jgi:hypothetical protein
MFRLDLCMNRQLCEDMRWRRLGFADSNMRTMSERSLRSVRASDPFGVASKQAVKFKFGPPIELRLRQFRQETADFQDRERRLR